MSEVNLETIKSELEMFDIDYDDEAILDKCE